jgi:integral membrane sensor domain MASE1
VEASYQHFTLTDWVLASTAFIYIIAVWNEYLMGYLAYIFMPVLLNSVIRFGFLAVEILLAHLVYGEQRAYVLTCDIGAVVGLA